MQLCKCFNCFLKTHNKQSNKYLLNLKKKIKKWFRSGRVDSQKTWVGSWVNSFLLPVKIIEFGSGIFQVGSGQKIITYFTMSTHISLYFIVKYIITLIFSFRDGNGAGRGRRMGSSSSPHPA